MLRGRTAAWSDRRALAGATSAHADAPLEFERNATLPHLGGAPTGGRLSAILISVGATTGVTLVST